MSSGTMMRSSSRSPVTAFFQRHTNAEDAIGRLPAAGITQDCIRLTAGDGECGLRPAGGTGPLPFPEASARL